MLGVVSLVGVILLSAGLAYYQAKAANFDLAQLSQMPQRSNVYDRHNRVMGRLHGENRVVIGLDQVSENFLEALLAREDEHFYRHQGVDYLGVVRAAIRNFQDAEFTQGASTITMQLARNAFQLTETSLHRKAVEVFLARRIESELSKEEILAQYINRIYFGSGFYGIERASQAYFEKPARSLSLTEGAMLAGLIRSPTTFSPFNDLEAAHAEMRRTINRMQDAGLVSAEEAEAAKAVRVHVRPPSRRVFLDSYAMDAVRRDLDLLLDDEQADLGGLEIFTDIDLDLQLAAEEALEEQLLGIEQGEGYPHQRKAEYDFEASGQAPAYMQGAVVIIDNATGGLLAIVGGRDITESKFNRALHARRQVGSIFKPFVYLAAFERGLHPETLISDQPIGRGEIPYLDKHWSPKNSDGKYLGWQPARVGLVRSRNTMSVRVGEWAGLGYVKELAASLGLRSRDLPDSPVTYIGTFEGNLRDLTGAYTIFPNQGVRLRPYVINQIKNSEGKTIYRSGTITRRVTSPGAAVLASQTLERVMDGGTGAAARTRHGFQAPAGGKTGTTDDFRDAWFLGYTSSLTCGVWVGLDEPKRTVWKGYGSRLSLPVWTAVMKRAEELKYAAQDFRYQAPMTRVTLCRFSGLRATSICRDQGHAHVLNLPQGRAPRGYCPIHRKVEVRQVAPPPRPSPPKREEERRWFPIFGGKR